MGASRCAPRIVADTYERQRDARRESIALLQSEAEDAARDNDIDGVLDFAEPVLTNPARHWQSRLRTAVACLAFRPSHEIGITREGLAPPGGRDGGARCAGGRVVRRVTFRDERPAGRGRP
jgi:hypothetical protein